MMGVEPSMMGYRLYTTITTITLVQISDLIGVMVTVRLGSCLGLLKTLRTLDIYIKELKVLLLQENSPVRQGKLAGRLAMEHHEWNENTIPFVHSMLGKPTRGYGS